MPKMDPFYEGCDIYDEYHHVLEGGDDSDGTGSGNDVADATPASRPSLWGRKVRPNNMKAKSSTSSAATSTAAAAAAASTPEGIIHMILARKRTKRILAFGKRDFVFLSVKDEPLEDGTWVSGTVSVETPSNVFPRTLGYTRAFQDSVAFYKPLLGKNNSKEDNESSGGSTKLTIVCRIDLNDSSENGGTGGWIPMWLFVKTIGATGARSVLNMRKALLEEKKERQRQQKQEDATAKDSTMATTRGGGEIKDNDGASDRQWLLGPFHWLGLGCF